MSRVLDCTVTRCSYNKNKQCHAMAIQVGGPHPACDTYTVTQGKAGFSGVGEGVGACKVGNCMFNQNLECSAGGIHVGIDLNHADCKTFKEK